MKTLQPIGKRRRAGTALVVVVLALMVVTGFAAFAATVSRAARNEERQVEADMRALYLAEAGVAHAVTSLISGDADVPWDPDQPVAMGGGSYWVEATDNGDGTTTLLSRSTTGSARCSLEAVVRPSVGDVYANALFAGNSSGDPTYAVELGGVGVSADEVDGDVYSSNDVVLVDDASVSGTIRAGGAIVGASGETGVGLPIPDVLTMDYETTNDVDVVAEFAAATPGVSSNGGDGVAWQLPDTSPAHVFRRNPSDRSAHTALTAKDDYFLEDPWETLGVDAARDGTDPYPLTLSGVGGEPGPDGNDLVYFVDGNLWIMNLLTNSFEFNTPDDSGFRVTIVVKGNIYLSDNLFYENPDLDGVALIALEDPLVPDSGNVYMGDLLDGSVAPITGSLTHVDAFMYAENDFQDNNLDHLGLGELQVRGNFSAGNQIHFDRDLVVQRSKLTIDLDRRVLDGSVTLPGLPLRGSGRVEYELLSTRTVALD